MEKIEENMDLILREEDRGMGENKWRGLEEEKKKDMYKGKNLWRVGEN